MLNVNVGVLGHVDCGKTSLGELHNILVQPAQLPAPLTAACWCLSVAVAALSTTLSTAALDKHPQSKERGITLDLGFSAFTVSSAVCATHNAVVSAWAAHQKACTRQPFLRLLPLQLLLLLLCPRCRCQHQRSCSSWGTSPCSSPWLTALATRPSSAPSSEAHRS